jgi:subtilisin family serine protease
MSWPGLWRSLAVAVLAVAAGFFVPVAAAGATRAATDREILVMVRIAPDHFRPGNAYTGSYGDELGRSARERIARGVARKFKLTLVENWAMPMIGVDCFVMLVPDARSTSAAAEQVSLDPQVSWAEPVEQYISQAEAPDDPLFAAEPAATQWHLADLHRMASGRGTRIAVVDSGIDADHPDLAGQLIVNRNFVSGQPLVPEQHGTAVAGIIAAKGNNRLGIVGVAPGARLLGLRACLQGRNLTTCDTLSLAKALYFAVENKANVINLSLSGPNARLLRQLLEIAYARGIQVVAAFDAKLPGGGFPASLSGVIAVSDTPATGLNGNVYVAPGREVPTTETGGRWFLVNGSSFAAAHVSGLVALIREHRPSAPVVLVSQRRDGAIDACASLLRAMGGCDCPCGSSRSAIKGHGL